MDEKLNSRTVLVAVRPPRTNSLSRCVYYAQLKVSPEATRGACQAAPVTPIVA